MPADGNLCSQLFPNRLRNIVKIQFFKRLPCFPSVKHQLTIPFSAQLIAAFGSQLEARSAWGE